MVSECRGYPQNSQHCKTRGSSRDTAIFALAISFCDGQYFDVEGETSKAHNYKVHATCSNAVVFVLVCNYTPLISILSHKNLNGHDKPS